MEIIYIITCLLLFISTMLIKKSDKKQNILLRGTLSIILFSIYNILLGFLFLVFKVKFTLVSLSIVNMLISLINIFIIYRKKETQKYFIKLKDVLFMILLLIVILTIAVKHYGFPLQIKYDTTDPSVHLKVARDIYTTKTLKWDGSMPAASINTAILFDTFDIIVPEYNFYYLFIIFDLIILYLIGAILYLGIINRTESKSKSIIAMIFSILFICAYPLNSMLFGFSYLTVGILYITTLMVVAINIKNDELKFLPLCLEMFLVMFGIFFSYYLFVPVIYASFGLYMLFDMIKNRKNKNIFSIITKDNILKVLIILILPTIFGFCYFILPGLIKAEGTALSSITREGYIYRDLYSNFVLLAPFAIFYILYNIKNKKNSFSTILMLITSLFTLILLKKGLNAQVSSYYYYKMYYLLWIIVVYMNIKAMLIMIENKNELITYSFTIIYLGIIFISYNELDNQILNINPLFDPYNNVDAYTNIYTFNKNKIKSKECVYNESQLEGIKYLLNLADNKKDIRIVGNILQLCWANATWKITDTEIFYDLAPQEKLDMEEWINNEEKKYLIYFDIENNKIEKETEQYKTIYEKEDVIIIEKK